MQPRWSVPGNGGATNRSISLPQAPLGYFDALLTVRTSASGRELWRQSTGFVLLPPDTRTAGAESPFGTWSFGGIHGTCGKLEVLGPIMQKLGTRHLSPGTYAESNLAPYKLSYSMANWFATEASVTAFIEKNPTIRLGMIYHETASPATEPVAPYAELLGEPMPVLNETDQAELDAIVQGGVARGSFYRTNYPAIRITVGNTHSPLIVQLIRHGFPRQYIDCFGMEGVGGYTTTECQPEGSMLQEVWWVREIQRIYGCADIPVSSGYE